MWSIIFVLLSYLDRNLVRSSLNANKESSINEIVCAKVSKLGGNFLYQVTDGEEVVRSTVSPTGTLVNCSVSASRVDVQSFEQDCRVGTEDRDHTRLPDARFARMDKAKEACSRYHSAQGGDIHDLQVGKTLKRSRRGFTYPGTLWCGAGNMADNYNQLGEFADTDSCCRTHDHCPHVIHAFSSNYGYTNFKWHSICHCDCDNALKTCLRKVKDLSSRVVGQAFFNVIGVPCFKFVYEEQCAERHWYGKCKRYEQFPIAILEEAVPYDFGGITVIDELEVAPSKNKSADDENQESTTQSTTASAEEPSLRNVVTAAEDFIKVLATVSTSQSSNAESEKDQGQRSEKKKKKNIGKKKKKCKKPKRKGKGRKKIQKPRGGAKHEEGPVVLPPGSKAEVQAQGTFISESQRPELSSRNINRTRDGEFEKKDKPFNKVMKDEPGGSEEKFVYIASLDNVRESSEVLDIEKEISLQIKPIDVSLQRDKASEQTHWVKRKKSHHPSFDELMIDSQKDEPVKATPTPRLQQQSTAESTGNQLKERRAKGGGNTWREILPSPTRVQTKQIQEVKPPNVPSIPILEQQISHTPDSSQLKIQVTTLKPSFSVLKSQRLNEKTHRKRRRKIPAFPLEENTLLSLHGSDKVFPNFLTSERFHTTNSSTISTTIQASETDWSAFSTTALTVRTKQKQQKTRQRRKPRRPAAALGKDNAHFIPGPVPLSASPTTHTEALTSRKASAPTFVASAITPLQLSREKLRVQLMRKKRRKAALLRRTV